MVDVRDAVGLADAVDVLLRGGDDRRGGGLFDQRSTSRPLTCTAFDAAVVTSSPLMTRNLSAAPCSGVQAVDRGQEVVIGQHEELVAVLAIPATTSSGVLSPSLFRVWVWVLPL